MLLILFSVIAHRYFAEFYIIIAKNFQRLVCKTWSSIYESKISQELIQALQLQLSIQIKRFKWRHNFLLF